MTRREHNECTACALVVSFKSKQYFQNVFTLVVWFSLLFWSEPTSKIIHLVLVPLAFTRTKGLLWRIFLLNIQNNVLIVYAYIFWYFYKQRTCEELIKCVKTAAVIPLSYKQRSAKRCGSVPNCNEKLWREKNRYSLIKPNMQMWIHPQKNHLQIII